MVDLYLLCADLNSRQSVFRQRSNEIISDIFLFLNRPSPKTRELMDGWKEDFKYIYGEVTTNLSSNNKLDKDKLFAEYGIPCTGGDSTEKLQLLFFSIQTYFCLLTKYVMKDILRGIREEDGFSYREIILGDFAKRYGITNYCYADWYCWPVFELENGFSDVMDRICASVGHYRSNFVVTDVQWNSNSDFIKQIYEATIPKELRHALGEYYTPDWLAESTLKTAIGYCGSKNLATVSLVDPTCGSGTFLMKAISMKREMGCGLAEILSTVRGMDINPLAVLTAKTNYLLSVLDLIDGVSEIMIPIYNADIVRLDSPANGEGPDDFYSSNAPGDVVRSCVSRDRAAVQALKRFDIVVGNPPWVNWEYLPEQYRKKSQQLWIDYKLFSAKGRNLSFSKEDISVLITYIVIDKLLKENGIIGFVIRQGIFKSAQNGAGFRRFRIRDEEPVKVLMVEDLSRIRAFENALNSTALLFAQKGKENVYPVPYMLWEKRSGLKKCSFGPYSNLREVMGQIAVTEQYALPAVDDDATSLWITAAKESLGRMKKILGMNSYRARTGVFTGGANAVYWLNIDEADGNEILVSNIVKRAKRKSEQVAMAIEKDFVFPMLKGADVSRWNTAYDTYLLCPHTADTKMWPVPQGELSKTAPKTWAYLTNFRNDLEERNGFAGWERGIQQKEFHAILRIGGYTFSRYKVIWKYIATEFICAVISTVNDRYLGEKLLLPNEKIMYVSTDDETEAYYLCGMLSSTPVAECVKSYMNPTSISAHVLDKLYIPQYDPSDRRHIEIAGLCKAGHGKLETAEYIGEIDRLAAQLYGIT